MALTKFFRRLSRVIYVREFSHSSVTVTAVFCLALVICIQRISAADGTWNVDADGLWSNPANWLNGVVADTQLSNAYFSSTNLSANRTVTLDSSRKIADLFFNDTGSGTDSSYTLGSTGGAVLTLAHTGGESQISVSTGNFTTISAPIAGSVVLRKIGGGVLALTGSNTLNYQYQVQEGDLRAIDGVGIATNSLLILRGDGATFQSSGNFTRILGNSSGAVRLENSGSGFSAFGGTLNVNLGGNLDPIDVTNPNFRTSFALSSTTADSRVNFQNGLNLGQSAFGGVQVSVADNPAVTTDIAEISGVISGLGQFNKAGNGALILTNSNSYSGTTIVSGGTLQIGDGGTTGNITNSPSLNINPGTTLTFNRNDTFTFSPAITSGNSGGKVVQMGTGTTILTSANSSWGGGIEVRSGTLRVTKFGFGSLQIGSGTLDLSGSFLPDNVRNTTSTTITGAASITRSTGGTSTIYLNAITFTPGTQLDISIDNLAAGGGAKVNGVLANVTVGGRLSKNTLSGYIVALADADYTKIKRLGGQVNSDWITNTCTIRALQGEPNVPITMATPGITEINSFSNLADDGPTEVAIGEGNTLRLGTKGVILNHATAMSLSFTGGTLTAGGNTTDTASLTINNATATTIGSSIADNGTGKVSLIKVGSGTTNLTATNTYTGDTVVGNGMLDITGSHTTGANYSINSGANLITNNVRVTNGLTVDGLATIRANGSTAGASKVESLVIGASGKLNLKDNDLVVGTGSVAAVRSQIKLGKNNNAASGITSDVAGFGTTRGFGYAMGNDGALSPLLAGSLSGQSYDANSVLVKYTFLGDADLDGDTDLNDLGLWANAFTGDLGNPANPVTFWTSGDFDYDGDTDLNDLGFWAGTFTGDLGGGVGSLVVAAPNAPEEAVAALNNMGITVVPEPSTIVLAGLGAIGLIIAARQRTRKML